MERRPRFYYHGVSRTGRRVHVTYGSTFGPYNEGRSVCGVIAKKQVETFRRADLCKVCLRSMQAREDHDTPLPFGESQ